jgi:hypothetical protein
MKRLFINSIIESQVRLEGLKMIDPRLDLGNGLSIENFNAKIDNVEKALNEYNGLITDIEARRSELRDLDRDLRDMRELFRLAVAAKYGKDSLEYVRAGGVRKSEVRRRQKSPNGMPSSDSSVADSQEI